MTWTGEIWYLRSLMLLILITGSIISYYAFMAWRHTRLEPMLYLSIGFGLVSVAAAAAGVLFEVATNHDYLTSWIVSAAFMLVGFLVILYSLMIQVRTPAGETTQQDVSRQP